MAIRRRRRMFILFAERKVGEQHGPAAQGVLAAVQTLREMNADNLRKVPADAPTAFAGRARRAGSRADPA
uniref:Mobile element protein n=1 Tax=Klebsiella pneumoniae TaxID=573 RepID=A0A6G9HLB0_KLEPN|nr:Mobile element protein [Klebsiella pneumoniae]